MVPLRFILVCLAGWINRQQQDVIAYLNEEVAVLKEQIGRRRIAFTDHQRRRLAVRARRLRLGRLREIANIVTPQTLYAWYRRLVAKKYDSSKRRVGRPRTRTNVTELVRRASIVLLSLEKTHCGMQLERWRSTTTANQHIRDSATGSSIYSLETNLRRFLIKAGGICQAVKL